MDQRTQAVRAMLRSMAPAYAIPYIQRFQLPIDEEYILIQCECRGQSIQHVALDMCLSVETVKRRRRSALRKISQGSMVSE